MKRRLNFLSCFFLLFFSFVLKGQTLEDYFLKTHIDKTVTDKKLIKQLNDYFQETGTVKSENNVKKSNISIYKENKFYYIKNVTSNQDLFKISDSIPEVVFPLIQKRIEEVKTPFFLKNLDLKNSDYDFTFTLLPVEYNYSYEIKEYDISQNDTIRVVPQEDYVVLQVENKGTKPIYNLKPLLLQFR